MVRKKNMYSKKKLLSLISFLVLAIGLPFALMAVLQKQDLRQRASQPDSVVFSLSNVTPTAINSEFQAEVYLATNSYDISAIDLTLASSNPNTLKITGFTPSTKITPDTTYSYEALENALTQDQSSLRYLGINSSNTAFNQNILHLGTIRLILTSNEAASIQLGITEVTARGRDDTLTILPTEPLATYVIPANTPTPTPTETPVPTTLPIDSPTPLPQTDTDGDGFTDTAEQYIGTNPNVKCGIDAWPLDFNNDNAVSIHDFSLFRQHHPSAIGQANYDKRYDLNADQRIDILDFSIFRALYPSTCS